VGPQGQKGKRRHLRDEGGGQAGIASEMEGGQVIIGDLTEWFERRRGERYRPI